MVILCLLPPLSFPTQEYALHAVEITAITAHRGGRLLFSADQSGCWKLHVAIPHTAVAAHPSTLLSIEHVTSNEPSHEVPPHGDKNATEEASGAVSPIKAAGGERSLRNGGMTMGRDALLGVGVTGPAAEDSGLGLGPVPMYADLVTAAQRLAAAEKAARAAEEDDVVGKMELVSVRLADMQALKDQTRWET